MPRTPVRIAEASIAPQTPRNASSRSVARSRDGRERRLHCEHGRCVDSNIDAANDEHETVRLATRRKRLGDMGSLSTRVSQLLRKIPTADDAAVQFP